MKKLIEGIIKFKEKDYKIHRELFEKLKNVQKPHTLFITCSDSRIDPNMMTGSLPGELFIVRNIANIVPPYRETAEYAATTSAIEYAVLVLGVENIIICGHSNCGGCRASLNPPKIIDKLPHTSKWLELITPISERILFEFSEYEPEVQEWLMEQSNVVEQIKHLMTYPYIHDKVLSGNLDISGWYYMIETGEVYIYDEKSGEFILEN